MEEYKEHSRSQRDKSRRIVVACMTKLEEKEADIEKIREEHDKALAFIARELALLQASMLKEQRRLEVLVHEKTRAAEALSLENERLKKQNKKLQSNVKMLSPDNDMDTPSSEDCSPKSSFSSKAITTKVEVKSRCQPSTVVTTMTSVSSSNVTLPSTQPGLTTTTTSSSSMTISSKALHPPASQKRPPPPPPPTTTTTTPSGPKPPVPSRAAVDKKLCRSPLGQVGAGGGSPSPSSITTPLAGGLQPPPPPPKRSTSLHTTQLERVDSGRESDLTSDVEQVVQPQRIFLNHQDEGFCSSHEEQQQPAAAGLGSVLQHGRQRPILVNHHRGVQKPSDLKFRSKVKATTSSLAVLEEASSDGSGGQQVTTVTYWTEPYL